MTAGKWIGLHKAIQQFNQSDDIIDKLKAFYDVQGAKYCHMMITDPNRNLAARNGM